LRIEDSKVSSGRRKVISKAQTDEPADCTDALIKSESYAYDANGNLTQYTDRRGTVDAYSYDGLNWRTFAGFGKNGSQYQDTISYTFDGGNRLTEAIDSTAGTVARTYDGLDRMTEEQSPQGDVTYAYDNANRRTSMTVAGQGAVSYAWDNANRLTGITQGSSAVAFAYDTANRRTTLTLPNGVTVAYTYDNNSRVTGLSYAMSSTQLGNLGYNYDADGRVTAKTGSFAVTGMPASVSGNTFNADNAMTAFNGSTMSGACPERSRGNANGNLTGDGNNTYAWDARNHLSAISGTATASFVYDAFGRRMSKTINGPTTQLLYDGWNPVQELQSGTPSANLLTGLNIDEYFTRTDSGGTMAFLSDTLGSTIGLTNSAGALATNYTYQPFGAATTSGTANTNSYQFTGRENDGTGLSFYRARYYSPAYQRFISQDPIGFAAGDSNLYGYVTNSPTDFTDPSGSDPRSIPFRCKQCGAPHGGLCGDYCPDCDKKSSDPQNNIPPNPYSNPAPVSSGPADGQPGENNGNEPDQSNSGISKAVQIGIGVIVVGGTVAIIIGTGGTVAPIILVF